jgi:diguanylate cyclase (GGDEF)-like protein
MYNNRLIQFDTFEDFFEKRIMPRFLIFSYLGLFLSIAYLSFDYSNYQNSPYLSGVLGARGCAIFFALMVVLASKLEFFHKKRVLAITTFGTLGYTALTYSYLAYDAPSHFVVFNWFFYLTATMMLGALMTKKIFIVMESYQIAIVFVLMYLFDKSSEEIFIYGLVAFSLVVYVYAVVALNRKNGEEAYANAHYMQVISSTDGLSHLLNRRSWYERCGAMFEIEKNVSFIMLDIDHFKKVNDTYGHEAGDLVIKTIANILMEHTRETDLVGRLGGEEFGIFLPKIEHNELLLIAERLRDRIENETIIYGDLILKVTSSFGVVSKNEEIATFKDLVKKGDDNLYKAKETGRNRVVFGC